MLGNATFTMLTSTNTMKIPRPVATIVSRWRGVIARCETCVTVISSPFRDKCATVLAQFLDIVGWTPTLATSC